MRDILEYFRDNAGFKEGKDRGRVKIFTALDSIVDREQSTDIFIEVQEKDGTHSYIKGDGSLLSEKVYDRYSKENDVDVIFNIGDIPDPQEKPEEYQLERNKIGDEFVQKYLARPRAN